jgi:hypothetical protein
MTKETIFTLNLHWEELFSDFCCDNGSPDGRGVQEGFIDGMIYQRHVGGFLVFPVCGVWFNLQAFASFQHILWPSSYAYLANFDVSSRHWVKLCLCSLMRTSKCLIVSPM